MVKTLLLIVGLAMPSSGAAAQAGRPLNEAQLCGSFRQAGNGCWQPTSTIKITSRSGPVAFPRGSVTCPGQVQGGVDIAAALNRRCVRP
jgi:hypothetical protein